MRVLIDTTSIGRGPSGTATYLSGLIGALNELDRVEVLEASAKPRRRGKGDGAGRGPAGFARSAANLAAARRWLRHGLPARARESGADVVHHPLPAWSAGLAGAQVITVHDLAFERLPWAFDPAWRAVARVQHRRAALRADGVICVSQTTANDVRALWGLPPDRVSVAPHGAPAASSASDATPSPVPQGRLFALYVGDAEPRKNLPTLLAAWERHAADARRDGRESLALVVAGSAAACEEVRELEREAGPDLIAVDRPADSTLRALYASAELLVHPSLHEGFGLTPLEAMANGTAVLAARSPGLVEVCADAASYFDPRDPQELARRLSELAADPDERRRLGLAGERRAAVRLWSETAELHVDAYEMALTARKADATPAPAGSQ